MCVNLCLIYVYVYFERKYLNQGISEMVVTNLDGYFVLPVRAKLLDIFSSK